MNSIISEILTEANEQLAPSHFDNIHRFLKFCENVLGRTDKDLVELRMMIRRMM